MLLGIAQIGREKIVSVLALHGPSTARQLLELIRPTLTKQALYQELRKLTDDGVVIKVGKLYSLRFAWVLKLQELAERMYVSSLGSAETLWLPTEKRKSWKLPDIRHSLQLWSHLSMILFRTDPSKTLYEYVPHAWYHLINSQVEEQFQAILQKEKIKFYLIVGDDTFLDRSYEKYFKIAGTEISFSESSFSSIKDEYVSVIGECIIRVRFPLKLARELNKLFKTVKVWGSDEIATINRVLATPAHIKLEITRNPKNAKKLTKQFREFFGV